MTGAYYLALFPDRGGRILCRFRTGLGTAVGQGHTLRGRAGFETAKVQN
jgi:hypothetical protein